MEGYITKSVVQKNISKRQKYIIYRVEARRWWKELGQIVASEIENIYT